MALISSYQRVTEEAGLMDAPFLNLNTTPVKTEIAMNEYTKMMILLGCICLIIILMKLEIIMLFD